LWVGWLLWYWGECGCFVVGVWGLGFFFFFFNLRSVWRVDRPLFTFHLDGGQSTFYASFFSIKKIKIRVGVKAKSSQVPDMFPIAC